MVRAHHVLTCANRIFATNIVLAIRREVLDVRKMRPDRENGRCAVNAAENLCAEKTETWKVA